MVGLPSILALGFFLGMRHATDPDHVIAVSTIVSQHRTTRGAALIGVAWGLGHTLTMLVVGGGIILLGWVIPPRLGLSLELSVGVMLVVLGVLTIARTLRQLPTRVADAGHHADGAIHSHAHRHGDYVHTHPHSHHPESHPHRSDQTPLGRLDRRFGSLGLYRFSRPLVVGVVHGLAGSAAVSLLVLATIAEPGWALFYLLVFGLGTVLGMMLITAIIAWPFSLGGHRLSRFHVGLRVASGVLSLGFGLIVAYQIGVVDGLFGSNPGWTPR